MAFRRHRFEFSRAVALVLAAATSVSAMAQGGFPPQAPPSYTPAQNAKDLKSVLFNWAWHMGMLRGIDEHELIVSLEYQGKGTVQVEGQPCAVTKYRASINYQTAGERIQYTCTRAGKTYSAIEVVSGPYAWNEDVAGAEIVRGKGKATPLPSAVQERLIRLWASPQGAVKAALQGANQPDPAKLADDGAASVGATKVTWEGGKPVVTFPIPGAGATATATLNAKYMAESVVVKHGSATTEFIYGDYNDWNSSLNKVEVLYAGKMTEKQNGKVVRDLTTTETETGSVYVVMPVPASVKAAIKVSAPFPAVATVPALANPFGALFGPPAQPAKEEPMPRTADGKPDMTGNWNSFVGFFNWRYGNRRCGPTQSADCTPAWNQTTDFEFEAPSRYGPNRPLYKPEFWDKVQQLDMWTNKEDPVMTCQPLGVPRQGGPSRIYQTARDITFIYGGGFDGGGGYPEYRIVPIDGRKHDPNDLTTRYMGHTVGQWEGDTLVLDSVGFNDQTWLGRGGFFHSDQMHVVEKLTRKDNEILYEVTVEDPEVLVEPWVMTPRKLTLNPSPDAGLVAERGNCEVYETTNITSQIRH
jgi:hypothetical protein